jgi:hypothetical protein
MSGNIKAFFVVIAVMMLVLSSCHMEKKENIYEGMSFEEFRGKNSEDSYFLYYGGYLFTKNNEGNHIVARMSDDGTVISKINCYEVSNIDNSDEAFNSIKEGMSIEEVVSIVGIPQGSYTSGMPTLSFESASGKMYWIYLNFERTELGMVFRVESVLLKDSEGE